MTQQQDPETPVNGKKLRDYASVLTAVTVVIGITAAVIAAWFIGQIESAEALAFLGPIAGGATAWLWVKQASADAAATALSQPTGSSTNTNQ